MAAVVPAVGFDSSMLAARVIVQQIISLATEYSAQRLAIRIGKLLAQRVHAEHHPFDAEAADPGVAPFGSV